MPTSPLPSQQYCTVQIYENATPVIERLLACFCAPKTWGQSNQNTGSIRMSQPTASKRILTLRNRNVTLVCVLCQLDNGHMCDLDGEKEIRAIMRMVTAMSMCTV